VKILAVVLLLALTGTARAGALTDCASAARAQPETLACLQAARRQATDRMLESFLAVEQKLVRLEIPEARERALAALKQSQRDFERYQHAHCQVAQRLVLGSAAGPLAAACEVDQIRARAAALEALDADSN
jgi:uncharacterized protein YecT (DUF1311 family)